MTTPGANTAITPAVGITISEFLQLFPTNTPLLHHKEPPSAFTPWVFWTESHSNNNSNNSSSSSAIEAAVVHEKLLSSFSTTKQTVPGGGYICQFWAPVTLDGGRQLLSTSGYPFAVGYLTNQLAMYRQFSEKQKYYRDVMSSEVGVPTTIIMIPTPRVDHLHWIPSEVDAALNRSVLLPICFASKFVGVLEFTANTNFADSLVDVINSLKKAGLYVFPVQKAHTPYKNISGIQHAKDEITNALNVVCRSRNVALANAWIARPDSSQQTLKLTGCLFDVKNHGYTALQTLYDAIPSDLALATLQDHRSRCASHLYPETLIGWNATFLPKSRALAVCLRSNDTSDLDYALEFIWSQTVDTYYGSKYLDSVAGILLNLKECLPRFKFASGAELCDELTLTCIAETNRLVQTSDYYTVKLVFKKRSSPMLAEAAENLHGPESAYPPKSKRSKANDSSIINTDEENSGAVGDPSTSSLQKNTRIMTIEADYGYGMLNFHLPVSQATFKTLKKEIGMKLRLSVGTFMLKYLDDDEDWILFYSEESMLDCIRLVNHSRCSRIRLRVLPLLSPQPL